MARKNQSLVLLEVHNYTCNFLIRLCTHEESDMYTLIIRVINFSITLICTWVGLDAYGVAREGESATPCPVMASFRTGMHAYRQPH